ncbi:MAG: spore cortex biosynthesis protein YabQ [Clostridia bacterium]|nr:spore cortex biosynthesis protein YabQ [Clostridia bacterium]
MTQYLYQESLTLLWVRAILWGAMLGAAYSVFGIRRAAFQRLRIPRIIGSICLQVEDFLIFVVGALGLCILYFTTTRGVLRLMAIPAIVLGILAWRLSGGRLVTLCTDGILNLLARLCRWTERRILSPIGICIRRRWRWIVAKRKAAKQRRQARKLEALARKLTPRYQRALSAACLAGTLPTLDRWTRGKEKMGKRIARKNGDRRSSKGVMKLNQKSS